MRKDLFLAFLGIWIAIIPFLPIEHGYTETAALVGSGMLVVILAISSMRNTS